MNPLSKFILLTLAVPMQTQIFSLFPFPFPLDLALIITYYWGYFLGKSRGMYMGAYLGLLTDILSGEILGSQMFLKTLTGYLAAVFGFGIFSRDFTVHFLLLAFFAFLNGLMSLSLVNLFGDSVSLKDGFISVILPSAMLTAFVGSLFIFLKARRNLHRDVLAEEQEEAER
jgi:rod shape-determining protein MreD